jgi:hypothetical protein
MFIRQISPSILEQLALTAAALVVLFAAGWRRAWGRAVVEQPRRAQLLQPRQVARALQAEVVKETLA